MSSPLQKRKVDLYKDSSGREPAGDWIRAIKDLRIRKRIEKRVSNLESGNFGDHRKIVDGGGVWELRLHFGPGYRIYYGEDGPYIVVLLCVGQKRTQTRDIRRAKQFWIDYLEQKTNE